MSTVYNLEPPTKGKVILKTSLGNIDIELWPKEAPMAVRNFVQLSLEGYYDGTIFHRMIKDFLLQGGDPTGTGEGGESIFGGPFKDEFHSRLRFNHRGLLACANQNEKNTNGSQFFITLDAASWLDKQNTIFGRVAGETIYNLLKFNELEVDDDDRPVEPPVLLEVEVVWNPFENIVPRITAEQRRAAEAAKKAEASKKPKREGKRKLALLSFGLEAEQEEQEIMAAAVPSKIRSAHEVLEDERLEKAAPEPERAAAGEELQRVKQKLADKQADDAAAGKLKKAKRDASAVAAAGDERDQEGEAAAAAGGTSGQTFAERMRHKMQARREEMGDARASKDRSRKDPTPVDNDLQPSKGEPGTSGRGQHMYKSAASRGQEEQGEMDDRSRRGERRARDDNNHDDDDDDKRQGRDEREQQGGRDGSDCRRGGSGSGSGDGGGRGEADDSGGDGSDSDAGGKGRGRSRLAEYKAAGAKRTLGRVITETQVENADLLKPYQVMREKYKQHKRLIGSREKETLERLNRFKQHLKGSKAAASTAAAKEDKAAKEGEAAGAKAGSKDKKGDGDSEQGYHGEVRKDLDHRKYMPAAWRVDDYLNEGDEDDDQGIEGLRGHVLKFSASEKKDHMARSDNVDDYVVFDPLLEKGKGKFSKMQQKEKKRTNEWAGRSVT